MTRLTIADIRAARAASAARYRVPAELTAFEFARILRRLPAHLPESDRYEADFPQASGRWWSSQREHMGAWFGQHPGYPTATGQDLSARAVYARLACPTAFPWIAEALGEDPAVVRAAADACRAEPDIRKRSAIMRRHLPWARIAELAERHR